jgi:hypothetical protein
LSALKRKGDFVKKGTLFVFAILMLLLSACGDKSSEGKKLNVSQSSTLAAQLMAQQLAASAPTVTATTAPAEPTPTPVAVELNTDYTDAVSAQLQLLAGSFKLEGTDQAISKDQASVLLPLWKNFETLAESMMPGGGSPQGSNSSSQAQVSVTPQAQTDNSQSQEQIKTLVKQITAAMTPAQIKAIADMKITQEIVQTVMTEQNITSSAQNSSQSGSSNGGAGGSGGGPGGGGGQPPSGSGGGGTPPSGSGGPGGSQSATSSSQSEGQSQGEMISTDLIKALVSVLEKKSS